ncbi:uncharacterized protein G2W53_028777 [Senna tora]|uniref:Uncharacterized protein n=1 Tax=Senna tora TaxID=362788 RepID=A0A834T1M1_9FABA|nr:uncharacterized protein G2W53_028777 [Senna tora]
MQGGGYAKEEGRKSKITEVGKMGMTL